jgi:RNA polymerase sigma-B factor
MLQGLAGLDDRELLAILRSLPRSSERRAAACEVLAGRYRNLVRSCVRRYRRSPEPVQDLMRVGYAGLLKAMNNFDPFPGRSLVAYAQAYIIGELKRHFRDKGWQVHVERSVRELVLAVREAARQLSRQPGCLPGDAELASYLGVSDAGIRDARRAELALRSWSLDEPLRGQGGAASLGDLLGEDDPQVEHMPGMRAVAAHWGELPGREQQILLMRFHGEHDAGADRPAARHLPDARLPPARPRARLPAPAAARPAGARIRRRSRRGTRHGPDRSGSSPAQGASRFAGEAARGGQGWRPSARRYLMTIKPGEEPGRRRPAQLRRALDAGTTASVSVISPCPTGETRPGTCP